MESNSYAVIIGINEYSDRNNLPTLSFAEKDAEDIVNVLTDPTTGSFDRRNVSLLLGKDATTRRIEKTLYTSIVKGKKDSDIVLVYFSGHGFLAGDGQKSFLGSYDVSILQLLSNPNEGLRMDYLHDEIFMQTKAQKVLFVLDACHSGAFAPDIKGGESGELLGSQFFSGGQGRVALVSSPRGISSRESADLKNGVFTHYLLRGLRGEAVEQNTGEVTLDSLMAYVRRQVPSNQPPGRYGQDYGRIVLSTPIKSVKPFLGDGRHTEYQGDVGRQRIELPELAFLPLYNPLEYQISYLEKLVTFLYQADNGDEAEIGKRILSAIRKSTGARLVYIQRVDQEGLLTKETSDFQAQGIPLEDYVYQTNQIILNAIKDDIKDVFNSARLGVYRVYREEYAEAKAVVLIPLKMGTIREFMVLCGLPVESILDEVHTRILVALFFSTRELTSLDVETVESAILDDLKKYYGFVPQKLYERRLKLFTNRLEKMIVHFEPILRLRKKDPYICGWEALARDPETTLVPLDLLHASELWGRKFMAILDKTFLEKTLRQYITAWELAKKDGYSGHLLDISVNVFPETLMRQEYFESLRKLILDSEILPSEKLVLEISEKRPIPTPDDYSNESLTQDRYSYFREMLQNYAKELNIGFAIDDFGVGESSIARLSRLRLSHVKIDRDILQQDAIEETIKYVLRRVSYGRASPTKVIVEGFDNESKISLKSLYDLGVHYVQGYIVGRASSELNFLNENEVQVLRHLINGGRSD